MADTLQIALQIAATYKQYKYAKFFLSMRYTLDNSNSRFKDRTCTELLKLD